MGSTVSIEIDSFRSDLSVRYWDLPPWGHPLSQCIMPLFMGIGSRLIPVGTAFIAGDGVKFVLTAAHNVTEVFKYEQRLRHLLTADTLPEALALKEVSFWLLYQHQEGAQEFPKLFLWPLESFNGAPPTDAIIGSAQSQTLFPTLSFPLSFAVPLHGERVRSVGYTNFLPSEGLDFEDVKSNTFNWMENYSHSFRVVEGCVEKIFGRRFTSKFVDGPCFTIDAEIFHGQSGGPVFDDCGFIKGVNSAGASHFFDAPSSIISLLYPLLANNVSSGVSLAPNFRINAELPLIHWIERGAIKTDGSEQNIVFDPVDGKFSISAVIPNGQDAFTFDDFSGFQKALPATRKQTRTGFRFRRNEKN